MAWHVERMMANTRENDMMEDSDGGTDHLHLGFQTSRALRVLVCSNISFIDIQDERSVFCGKRTLFEPTTDDKKAESVTAASHKEGFAVPILSNYAL